MIYQRFARNGSVCQVSLNFRKGSIGFQDTKNGMIINEKIGSNALVTADFVWYLFNKAARLAEF